jgi:hypothetical protein
MSKFKLVLASMLAVLFSVVPAFAQTTGDPYAGITSSVSWANVGTDAATVGVALAAVFIILRGIRMLVAFVRR